MRHSKWSVLAVLIAALPWTPGCSDCEGSNTTSALGLGRFIERGPNGERNEVETMTLDWGPVVLNDRVERKVVVRNVGSANMFVSEPTRDTAFSPAFNYSIPGFAQEVQTETELAIYFEPKDEGDYAGTLTFPLDGSANDVLVLNLKGRGIQGGCTITPGDTADFGSVALGTSFIKTIRIANGSEVDYEVDVGGIISESDKGTFAFSNFTPGKVNVPSHGEILVPIEFKPNHVGPHQAALSIPGPAMCQPSVLPLVGNGVDEVLECEPKVLVKDPTTGREKWECVLDFGFVNPNTKAVASVTFKNLGNQDITVSGLSVVQDPTKGKTFEMEKDASGKDIVEVVIPKTGSASVPLSFLPTLLGSHNGKLNFVSDDTKRPTGQFALLGTGGGPAIDTQPAPRIDFGPVAVKTFQRRRLTITNVGTDIQGTTDDNLKLMTPDEATSCSKNSECTSGVCQRGKCWTEKVAEIKVTQGDPSEFSLEWPPEGYLPQGIAAGQGVDLKVKFTPQGPGDKTAQLLVYSNDPAKPVVVTEIIASGMTMPPCDYDVIPPQLNFGNVENGKYLALSFYLRNKATNEQDECLISTLGFTRGTSTAFTLVKGPITGYALKGGESLEIPVRFQPKQDGTYTGAVEFYISSEAAPEGRVTLTGSAQKGCLLVAPNELDFGVIQVNCSSRERTFTIYNVCNGDQTLQSIDLQQGLTQEFHVVQTPRLPYTLASGASVDFKVKYSPVDVGDDQSSVAIKTAQLTQPYVIPINGRGDTTAIQTDVFAQDPQPKVDVLFVIDNSGSMYDKQTSLGANFESFIKFALAQGVDYHIAVTTTGVDTAHGGSDDNWGDPDENGCFYPMSGTNPRVITTQTPSAEQVFKQNCYVGTDGNASELMIRPAYLALTNPNITTCNTGFLRDEANLAVVLVSDAWDINDTVTTAFYTNALFNVKGYKRKNMFSYSAINPKDGSTACDWDPSVDSSPWGSSANTRVEQVVAATAGVTGDICTPDWAKTLEKLGQNAFGYRTRFFLSNTPDLQPPNVITVEIDGVNYPEVGPFGDQRWTYNSSETAIDFSPLAIPEPGSTITVSYHVACLH